MHYHYYYYCIDQRELRIILELAQVIRLDNIYGRESATDQPTDGLMLTDRATFSLSLSSKCQVLHAIGRFARFLGWKLSLLSHTQVDCIYICVYSRLGDSLRSDGFTAFSIVGLNCQLRVDPSIYRF